MLRLLLTIGLLVMFAPAFAVAQRGNTHAVLTRAQIKEAERRLSGIGYWTGPIDGVFDPASRSALTAFQKYERRPITGQMTIEELEAIRTSSLPSPREAGYAHVEVDLDRQVLLVVDHDDRVRVLPVSTGNDQPFVAEGQTSIAYTPRGRFLVYEKEAGWGTGPLGAMYYSNYISGGVAIHGSRSIPNQPASHGCIRVPMFAAREVSRRMPVGTIVLVYDKASFVSAKDWAMNPKLKEAALAAITANAYDYDYLTDATKTRPRTIIKKPRSRIIRA
jgi:peptidoglycan hydrolase-like protein with peptidoglycan-binding domain